MKIARFNSSDGLKIGVLVSKITGFCEVSAKNYGNSYICTGQEDVDNENGWYVKEGFEEVYSILTKVKVSVECKNCSTNEGVVKLIDK